MALGGVIYPTVTVHQGCCLSTLARLPAESVHCCITSPPYWGLRDYGCEGQIGLEPTPETHIAALVAVFRAVWRVLRKDGTLWLNCGDCYACAPNGRSAADTKAVGEDDRTFRDKPFSTVTRRSFRRDGAEVMASGHRSVIGLKPKDLVGMPWRLALALQQDGWWLRSAITWCKSGPMPESCKDRPASGTEMMFLLSRSEHYYYDNEAVRPLAKKLNLGRNGNLLNWWMIASDPYAEAHFATFPQKLVEPCLLAGTSAWGCCATCGAPFVRETQRKEVKTDYRPRKDAAEDRPDSPMYRNGTHNSGLAKNATVARETTGWAQSCSCPEAPPVPCTVLDPFGGSGTVAEVALSHGRSAVLIELSPEYCEMMKKRVSRAQVPLFTE